MIPQLRRNRLIYLGPIRPENPNLQIQHVQLGFAAPGFASPTMVFAYTHWRRDFNVICKMLDDINGPAGWYIDQVWDGKRWRGRTAAFMIEGSC